MRGAAFMKQMLVFRSVVAAQGRSLSRAHPAALPVSIVALLAGSFGLGYGLGGAKPEAGSMAGAALRASAPAPVQEQIDALAIRVGELNASVIRLNALGGRLTEMAGLDDGEFDFGAEPAIGGPEDAANGSLEIPGLTSELDALDHTLKRQDQQLSVLADLMVNRKLREDVRPRGRPVRSGYVSSYFGRRTDPFTGKAHFHRGLDFAAKSGTEVVAVAMGVVTWSGARPGYGRMVEINHGDGYVTRYAHNAKNLVMVGDHVEPGQTIALIGSSGRATGPNLHFEVWHAGRPVDPGRFTRQKI
jgi:murein DD-endopeptidase MepM/ murein hydrolase activator NlpD